MSRLTDARSELERYEKTKPADYQSQYQGQIKDVMGQLDGMGEFDYDPDADAAYQQYKSQYTRSAKLANQNAQANAAAQTGGYGSSYGTQAGQNAYAATMNNLDSVLDNLQNQSRNEYTARRTGLDPAERPAECGKAGLPKLPERLQQLAERPAVPAEPVQQCIQRTPAAHQQCAERHPECGGAGGTDFAVVLCVRKGKADGNDHETESGEKEAE